MTESLSLIPVFPQYLIIPPSISFLENTFIDKRISQLYWHIQGGHPHDTFSSRVDSSNRDASSKIASHWSFVYKSLPLDIFHDVQILLKELLLILVLVYFMVCITVGSQGTSWEEVTFLMLPQFQTSSSCSCCCRLDLHPTARLKIKL